MRKMFLLLTMSLIAVFFILTNPLVSLAAVRVEWVGPYYARIEPGWTIHTEEWAAVPFYRDPGCVPEDFNLLDFFDFENALDCPSFVEGFEIKENEIAVPLQAKLKAAEPMPIYFVPWDVMQDAISDGVLTMPELEALDEEYEEVQVGIATLYTEVLHPSGIEELGGGAQQTMMEVVAKGYMAEDNSIQFELKLTAIHDSAVHEGVKIEFEPAKSAPALSSQSKLAATWGEMKGEN